MTLEPAVAERREERAGYGALALLIVAYVGVYLCRKNLSVAIPLLQPAFGVTKAELGVLSTAGTVAYAAGKFLNGAAVDRLGGRRGLLLSMSLVAIFGAAGAFSPGLFALTVAYGLNRYAGSASWGAMLKLVPSWFRPARTGTAVGVLSLSYLSGGVLATFLAAEIVSLGGGWRAVMGIPALFLAAILALSFLAVRPGPLGAPAAGAEPRPDAAPAAPERRPFGPVLLRLVRQPAFLVICALSFTLTLMREAFNTWSVDFLLSIQGGKPSLVTAAIQSSGFDLAGFPSILAFGVAFDRVRPAWRGWLMAGSLLLLGVVLAALPRVADASTAGAAVLVGAVGLLVYGPYSLLAGALAVESGGKEAAATAAGIIDGVGYIAGALAGIALGKLLDVGGYALGFHVLAGMTFLSAGIALALRPSPAAADALDGGQGQG